MNNIERRNFIGILGINTCLFIMYVFVQIFLTAQVFTLSGYSITAVALFILVDVTGIFVFYIISAIICKKIPAIWMIRFAVILTCLFIVLTVVWENGLGTHFILFGALWGIVRGLYWGAMNFLTANAFDKKRTHTYFTLFFILIATVNILFPFSFGFAIDFGSWMITSGFVLLVGVIQLVISFFVKLDTQDKGKLEITNFYHALKQNNFLRPAMWMFVVFVLVGFVYTLPMIMTILIVMVYGTNISLGVMGTIFAATGIVFLITYKRIQPTRKVLFWISAFLPLIASVVLFFYVGVWSIIVFNACLVLRSMSEVESADARLNLCKYWGGEKYSMEGLLLLETGFWVGRVIACGILLFFDMFNSTILFPVAISTILLAHAAHATITFVWKRKYAR
ncbi:MAG: hypothetical protein FWE16_05085 [Firmicutes bacterium]|nr:hypothetical protein [Bacillota bacterium]